MKKNIMLILVAILIFAISGCGSKNNKADIIADLTETDLSIAEDVEITSAEILKRNTEDKTDEVYAKVLATGEETDYEIQLKLIYNHYTEGGWILDKVEDYNVDEWVVKPKNEMTDADLDSIKTEFSEYVADTYGVNKTGGEYELQVTNRESDVENGTENVDMKLTFRSDFRAFEIEAKCSCVYLIDTVEGEHFSYWQLDEENSKFTVLENSYENIAGDWRDSANSNIGYRIDKLSSGKYKLYKNRTNSGYTPYEITFKFEDNGKITITDYAWYSQSDGSKTTSSDPAASGAQVVLNDDGTIDVEPWLAFVSGARITKGKAKNASGNNKVEKVEPVTESVEVYEPISDNLYRVRKTANDSSSQLGAFENFSNAKKLADKHKEEGYEVYNSSGEMVYSPTGLQTEILYRVRKSANDSSSQLGAYSDINNAIKKADEYADAGYEVYDQYGDLIYVP